MKFKENCIASGPKMLTVLHNLKFKFACLFLLFGLPGISVKESVFVFEEKMIVALYESPHLNKIIRNIHMILLFNVRILCYCVDNTSNVSQTTLKISGPYISLNTFQENENKVSSTSL